MARQAWTRPSRLARTLGASALGAALVAALLIPAGSSARSQAAPKNVTEPKISGAAVQGRTLTTSNGTWSGTQPIAYQYRWLRCDRTGGGHNGINCSTILAETRKSYILSSADVSHRIRSRVIATNAEGTASANSNATSIVQASTAVGKPKNVSPPTISGTPAQNNVLQASPGSWTGSQPITFGYHWRRCDQTGGSCSNISGATQSTYTLKDVDVGDTLRVQITAKNSQGTTTATSAPTAVISKAGVPPGSAISINDVSLPNRLIIDRVSYRPSVLRSRRTIFGRFRVSDSHDHPVAGALVFAVGIPFGSVSTPPETATGPNGYVTLVFHPTRRAPIGRGGGIVFFVRARKAGEPLLGGVSTRRLTFLP
jgi:Ig domain of plant-specific actin-binding protein